MKNKLVIVTILFALMIISVTTVVYYLNQPANPSDIRSGQIIALNEIEKLMDQEDERAKEKISELEQDIRTTEVKDKNIDSLWMLCGINLLFLILIFG